MMMVILISGVAALQSISNMVHVPSFDNIIIFNLFGIISFVKTESDFEHLNAKVFLFITILLTSFCCTLHVVYIRSSNNNR